MPVIKKTLKIITITIMAILVTCIGAATFLITTIDQNTIKEKTSQFVYNKTGRDLKINGNINWTFFPWLGIKAENVSLSNPKNFKQKNFAKAEEIGVSVKLLPLIKGHVQANNLTIKNLNLNLITNNAGKSNWQDLSSPEKKTTTTKPTSSKKETIDFSKFTINKINMEDGTIYWKNLKTKKNIKISQLNFNCKKVNFGKPFPIKASFFFPGLTQSLDAKIKINTKSTLNVNKKLYTLNNLQLSSNLINKISKKSEQFNANTSVIIDLKKGTIAAKTIKGQLANTKLSATFKANNINQSLSFLSNLKIDKINTKEITDLFNTDKKPTKGTIRINNFTTEILGNSDKIELQKINFDFYQGKGSGNTKISLQKKAPEIKSTLALKDISIKPLLIDLADYKDFNGKLSFNTNINTQGKTTKEMLQFLNGNGNVLIKKGTYQGVDVPYEVRRARSILTMKSMPEKPKSPHTDFDQLTMTFNINNGLLNTNDFLITAPDYKVTGKGSANLTSSKLNLSLNAYSNNDKNFFVPIKITGTFTKPSIRPDTAVLLKDTMKKAVKGVGEKLGKEIEKHINSDKLKKLIPLDKLF